jgi:hypothetical protein
MLKILQFLMAPVENKNRLFLLGFALMKTCFLSIKPLLEKMPDIEPGGSTEKAIRISLKMTILASGLALGGSFIFPDSAQSMVAKGNSQTQKVSMVAMRMSGQHPVYDKTDVLAQFADIKSCQTILDSYLEPEESKNPISKWGIKAKKEDPRNTVQLKCMS